MRACNFVSRPLPLVLLGLIASGRAAAAAPDAPPSYPDAVRDIEPPAQPAHRAWWVEQPLPEDAPATYHDRMNGMLEHCLAAAAAGKTDGIWPDLRRSTFFGMYAVWGLVAPESRHAGNEKLGALLRTWMDEHYPLAGGDFEAGWKAWYLYGPLVEISARPGLRDVVGEQRLRRAVRRVIEDARDLAERRWPTAVTKSVEIVNFVGHGDAAALTLGWVLAREFEPELAPALFERAAFVMRMFEWHMRPNGTIRYIYKPHADGPQLVAESLYYHNINVRAIYAHWWFTGDERSRRLLAQQRPYYKLRVPPWAGRDGASKRSHYHSAIWWKEQWRTFWPGAVALSAAATEDGQLATIALTMAERGIGADRKFADWAVHGFKQMALRTVRPAPRNDRFVIADPDIGGLRMRFGGFSAVFSSNSYGFTLAGAMTPAGGLAGAYPLVRLDRLARNTKYAFTNLHIAGLRKPAAMLDIHDAAAAAAGAYAPHNQATTWRTPHVSGPWHVRQAWLYLPDRIVGLMTLRATGATRARSVEHIYRLMATEVTRAGADAYVAGDLRLTIVETNLAHRLVEPARRFSMSLKEPWRQVVLADRPRPAKPAARERAGKNEELLPGRTYEAGSLFYSLVELRRTEAPPLQGELISFDDDLLAFGATVDGTACTVAANFAAGGASRTVTRGGQTVVVPAGAVRLTR